MTYATVMASFCVEDFGARRTSSLSRYEMDHRAEAFRATTHFEHVPTGELARLSDEDSVRLLRPETTPSGRRFGREPHTWIPARGSSR